MNLRSTIPRDSLHVCHVLRKTLQTPLSLCGEQISKNIEMKKFDINNIDRTNIFETPEGYFKDLPSIIQAKAVQNKPESIWKTAFANPIVKLAIPALLIFAVFIWGGDFTDSQSTSETDTEILLAQLSVEEMQDYLLEETDMTNSDLVEIVSEIEGEITLENTQLLDDETLEDIDLEDLESLL